VKVADQQGRYAVRHDPSLWNETTDPPRRLRAGFLGVCPTWSTQQEQQSQAN
jgi:hypothetical protein